MGKNTGKEYERLTQLVFYQIINQNSVQTIDVKHDVILQGKTTSHQIDVYWEFNLGGIVYSTVIQAKDWKNKVPQKEMLAFKSIIDDLPTGTKGIYVAKSGYQLGAKTVAEANGIAIYELREPNDQDWKGRVKDIDIQFEIMRPIYKELKLNLDQKWIEENVPTQKDIAERYVLEANTIIKNRQGDNICEISDIIMKLAEKSGDTVASQNYSFGEDAFIEFNGGCIKVLSISGEFGYSCTKETFHIDGGSLVSLILKDIANNTVVPLDQDGFLLGGNDNA